MERENQTPPSNVNAFDKKVIYVYKHLDVKSHEGWLKVGETKASRITGDDKNMRIQEQNTAANVAYEVLYTTDAVTNSGYIFSDHDIHQLLEGMDIEREETINPDTNKKSEWFKTDLESLSIMKTAGRRGHHLQRKALVRPAGLRHGLCGWPPDFYLQKRLHLRGLSQT